MYKKQTGQRPFPESLACLPLGSHPLRDDCRPAIYNPNTFTKNVNSVARPMGLEPTTSSLAGQHSIPLSYGRVTSIISPQVITSYPAQSDRAGVVRVERKADDSRPQWSTSW